MSGQASQASHPPTDTLPGTVAPAGDETTPNRRRISGNLRMGHVCRVHLCGRISGKRLGFHGVRRRTGQSLPRQLQPAPSAPVPISSYRTSLPQIFPQTRPNASLPPSNPKYDARYAESSEARTRDPRKPEGVLPLRALLLNSVVGKMSDSLDKSDGTGVFRHILFSFEGI